MADDGELLRDKVRVDVAFDGHKLSNTIPWMWKPEGRPPAGLSRALIHAHGDDSMAWADADVDHERNEVVVNWPRQELAPRPPPQPLR